MGRIIFKPRRAKCIECSNGMVKKSPNGKYCASCRRTVTTRLKFESAVRTGRLQNPGVGTGPKPREDHPRWNGGGRDWQIREFRGTKCERCGSGGQMHLHHRDREVSNWKNDNLETLCVPCHNEEHKAEGGVKENVAA